jgi:hypothetical protein
MSFNVPIFVELKFPQWHYIKIFGTGFLQNLSIIVEITGKNLFTLLSKLCH